MDPPLSGGWVGFGRSLAQPFSPPCWVLGRKGGASNVSWLAVSWLRVLSPCGRSAPAHAPCTHGAGPAEQHRFGGSTRAVTLWPLLAGGWPLSLPPSPGQALGGSSPARKWLCPSPTCWLCSVWTQPPASSVWRGLLSVPDCSTVGHTSALGQWWRPLGRPSDDLWGDCV